MPLRRQTSRLARLGTAIADLVRGVLEGLQPRPEPVRIPVRARDRR